MNKKSIPLNTITLKTTTTLKSGILKILVNKYINGP